MSYIGFWIKKFEGMEQNLKIIFYCGDKLLKLYDKSMDRVVKNFVLTDEDCFDEFNEWINSGKYEIEIKDGNG